VLSMPAVDRDGRPLWPERWPVEELDRIKMAVGPREWAALYMQAPSVAGGAIFKSEWWQGKNRFRADDRSLVNSCVERVISWDTAEKLEEGNAFSARVVGELTPGYQANIRNVHRARLSFPDLVQFIEQDASENNRDGKLRAVLIEDKSSGTSAIQTLRAQGPLWLRPLITPVNPRGDKIQRGYEASTWCTAGVVLLPMPSTEVPWLRDYEEEMFTFPASTFKDQVDATTQLIWYWHHLLAAGLGINVYD